MLNYFLETWSGRYKGVYIPPRALYTKLTHSLIYFVATVKLEEKHEQKNNMAKAMLQNPKDRQAKILAKSVLVKVTGKDGLTYTVDTTVTFKKRNKFAQMDLIQLGD